MISEGNENEMNCVSKRVEPSQSNMSSRNFKMFEEVENAGSQIFSDVTIAGIVGLARSIHEQI